MARGHGLPQFTARVARSVGDPLQLGEPLPTETLSPSAADHILRWKENHTTGVCGHISIRMTCNTADRSDIEKG